LNVCRLRPAAREGLRRDIAVGEDGVRIQLGSQRGDHLRGAPVKHDEVTSHCTQARIQLAHAVHQKLYAPVVSRQAGQDVGIEHEHAEHAA
jgi:hypothetical protein